MSCSTVPDAVAGTKYRRLRLGVLRSLASRLAGSRSWRQRRDNTQGGCGGDGCCAGQCGKGYVLAEASCPVRVGEHLSVYHRDSSHQKYSEAEDQAGPERLRHRWIRDMPVNEPCPDKPAECGKEGPNHRVADVVILHVDIHRHVRAQRSRVVKRDDARVAAESADGSKPWRNRHEDGDVSSVVVHASPGGYLVGRQGLTAAAH